MPVSHIGLTVSHLPTSTSFFLSALQPLGYRYIGQYGNQIGLGINDSDFFLCQETPGVKAGAAHIAFTAPSTTAVRNFYTAALTAGGRPNGAPGARCAEDGHFNAAVIDFDGNSIEVVYRNGPDMRHDGTIITHSRVITWQRTVSQSFRESPSIFSAHTCASRTGAIPVAPTAESAAPKAPSPVPRSASAPTVAPVPEATTKSDAGSGAATHILGTLLGAAAGAAVTYAFMRSERDSAKKEADFSAFMDAKNAVNTAAGFFAQASSQPPTPQQAPQPAQPPVQAIAPPTPEPVHRIEDDARSSYSRASQIPRNSVPRQIEAAPADYYSPSQFERPRSRAAEPLAIEYAPAYSVAPSQTPSRLTPAHRSNTSPELLMIERARSTVSTAKPESVAMTAKPPRPSSKPQSVVSKAQSVAHSAAPSSFISSFVADREDEKSSSGRSKARSSHTSSSKHSSHKEHGSSGSSRKERGSSPSPPAPASKAPSAAPTKAASKAASIVSSIFSRDKKKHDDDDDFIDDLDIEELSEDDLDTVVPSDSISQIGDAPRRKHRSHRSDKSKKDDDAETSVSHRRKKHSDEKESSRSKKHDDEKESSRSKKHDDDKESSRSKKHDDDNESIMSKSSKRSHRSHRSRKTSADSADDEDSSRPHRSSRSSKSKPSIISEPSEVSTVRPVKPSKSSRKDSLTQGQYDNLFDEVQYGTGAVHASRGGPTPSMVSAARKNPIRSMINHNHATKMRNFEGSQAGRARDSDD
ncbi:uncharacterized protein J4E88_001383 [Alternaria novae-zelandiae]|uniref:uncharacterized protein n=1 Tax=Alternaria triticimaculans TaxID=297637 RepID=UPI0020C43B39|nr:uncharacterized protein J4E78_002306 [Alternaria triticimaculans]XP_049258916.1 uncharacterized protein J4E88_001383 [Alternaria novae-zelandiae]XP_051325657.1 uncharacterized protein J4E85_005928 [Alternaria conjuncta]XP_051349944.1 uncharacterized protein J4E92_008580 [Alternaria infectoria]KAI4668479.1 hypothetical protein J4E78_002306 [Alternaria triticimaculans]KAI4693012.1 hypothetical protein J4E88_001383 [Alternaria novae-zelandiae]KAI4920361.1 hypothetical protein J4E92_008580 [Al